MSRHRSSKSLIDRAIDEMASAPWQVSAISGLVIMLLFGVWRITATRDPFLGHSGLVFGFVALFFGGGAGLAVRRARRDRRALFRRTTLRDLRAVPWQEFERLAGAYYREQGYTVVHTGEAGPDGGFDLVLHRDGERILVQCKKWDREAVGVALVREFFGVVISEGASRGIFITTSTFTGAAMEFGLRHASLELIPGPRFAEMVSDLRNSRVPNSSPAHPSIAPPSPVSRSEPPPRQRLSAVIPPNPYPPLCPRCDAPMVLRTAGRGGNAGGSFWGCSNFSSRGCRGTRPAGEYPMQPHSFAGN